MNLRKSLASLAILSLTVMAWPAPATATTYDAALGALSFSKTVVAIQSITGDGTTVTVQTSTPHYLGIGDEVSLTGVPTPFDLTGATVAAVTSATEFTILDIGTGSATGGLVEVLQADGSQLNDFGAGMAVNGFLDYVGIANLSGTQINARVTLKRLEDITIDKVDDAAGVSGRNAQFRTELDATVGTGVGFAEFEIKFFTGTISNPTYVTLNNFYITVYDIDDFQMAEFSGWSRYFRDSNTILSIAPASALQNPVGSSARFSEAAGGTTNGNEAFTKSRVTLEYSSASTLVFLLGQDATNAPSAEDGDMTMDLDFSEGWNTGGEWSATRVAVNTEPVVVPRSVPYEGPLNLQAQSGTLCSGGAAVITGQRLNTITEIYVGDKKVAQELLSDGRLKYSLKDIAPGTYQIRYWVPVNSLNLTDQIRVGTCSTAPVATAPGTFEASRLFANYRGDRGPVIARDRAAITAFINQYKGITSVKCVGSTSGVPAKSTDPALATARAQNACDIVKTLVPNATYTLETSTGKGVGQRFRSVTIFISGTN